MFGGLPGRIIYRLAVCLGFLLFTFGPGNLSAQMTLPESAHVDLYFPQFADGGPFSEQWQTIFTFSNPNAVGASLTLYLVGNNGQPLQMDFGSGPVSQVSLYVPPKGSSSITSRVASPAIVAGWAEAVASLPLQGVVSYRFLKNSVPAQEISVPATLPSPSFFAPANSYLSLAIVNGYSSAPINLKITARSNDGPAQQAKISLPPFGHRAFALFELFPGLTSDFVGTVEITGADADVPYFVALALKTDRNGMFSSLPSGLLSIPVSQFDRMRKVFNVIRQAASAIIPSPTTIQLYTPDNTDVDAGGSANGITMEIALAEILNSDSELAFAMGHELGHVYQARAGSTANVWNPDSEFDADAWGFYFVMLAGYDPYAAVGVLAKLYTATGAPGLTGSSFEGTSSADMHKSLGQRLDAVQATIQQICSDSTLSLTCKQMRQVFHPSLPDSPL